MGYEVEQKFVLGDAQVVSELLRQHGAELGDAVEQADEYFAHPARDFAATDEALRIRRVGAKNWITYKGPKLDATTKTRREINLPLAEGERVADETAAMFVELGFRPVAKVRKKRRVANISWQGHDVELACDQVDGLGSFLELEIEADDTSLDAARAALTSLAAELGLGEGERRSYLELILAR